MTTSGRNRPVRHRRRPASAPIVRLGGALLLSAGLAAPVSAAVLHVRVDSPIQPVVLEFLGEAVAEAEARQADALVVELSTPGGALDATRSITTLFLGSPVPVVVYVSPSGAHAASAGFFILLAADVAAMAPGTNTGAAHPVAGGGQDIPGTLGKKVEEDAAAQIRSLAVDKGRDVELAQSAVLESRSFTAEEALANGLVDVLADDLEDLLQQLDGRVVVKADREVVLATAAAPLEELDMSPFQRLRAMLVHPNVVAGLLSLAILAIGVEIYNPGAIFPGTIGVIALVLAGYGMSILPVSWAGAALMVLAVVFFALEVKLPSFGVLTAGGVLSLVLGMLFLFKTPDPALRVSLQFAISAAIVATAIALPLMFIAVRAQRSRVRTGREGLIGERGTTRTAVDPRGKVQVHGEIWDAVAANPIAVGERVEVVAVDGMTLEIRPSV